MQENHVTYQPEESKSTEIIDGFLRFNDELKQLSGVELQSRSDIQKNMDLYLQTFNADVTNETAVETVQTGVQTEIESKKDFNSSASDKLLDLGLISGIADQSRFASEPTHTFDFEDDTFDVTLSADSETYIEDHEKNPALDGVCSFPMLYSDKQLNNDMDILVQNSTLLAGEGANDATQADSLFARGAYETDAESSFEVSEKLLHARNNLARLSVDLRGKNFKSLHKNLQTEYARSLQEYKDAYRVAEHERTAALWVESNGDDSFDGQFAAANLREHALFIEAEKAAYKERNPEPNYLVGKWATYGSVKRFVIGATAGAGLAALAMPVATGAAGLFVGGLTYKAAKTLGMYKLNKKAGVISEFDKKAAKDTVKAATVNTDKGGYFPSSIAASNQLVETINGRVESDRKENRKRLVMAVGSVAIGAVAGTFLHDRMTGRSRTNGSTSKRLPGVTVKPEPTSNTVSIGELPSPTPTIHPINETQLPVRPHAPYIPKPAGPQIPAGGADISSLPDTGVTRIPLDSSAPGLTPLEVPAVSQINTEQLTWEVAHDFAPGHETAAMQQGIDAYNYIKGTHFALTPHNSNTWIIDNGRAIIPAEMFKLNELLIEDDLLVAA